MQDIKLEPAGLADIESISGLANIIWNQHYTAIIGQNQIDYMLDLMYSKESLTEQMQIKKHQFFLVKHLNGLIGFISVHNESGKNWFLNKFYINQNVSAKGIGSKAFDELLSIIQAKKITLTVNRQNFKSVNFYFKNGFKIDHIADFDIGGGYVMNDFVMVWKSSK